KVIEQGQRNERSIDYRNKGQRTYTRPFPLGRKIDSRNAIADDNGANKAIKDRGDAYRPDGKLEFWQEEKSETDNKVEKSRDQCQSTFRQAKSEVVHIYSSSQTMVRLNDYTTVYHETNTLWVILPI